MQQILRSEDLDVGTATEPSMVCIDVGGDDVMVCRMEGGDVVAFAARCPHQGTSLEEATFFDGKLRCARHLYLYDPASGENIIPARDARPESLWKLKPGYLPVYRVEERDGWIWVADQPEPPPAAYDPAREERPATTPTVGSPGGPAAGPVAAPAASAGSGSIEHGSEQKRVRVGKLLELVIPVNFAPAHVWRLELPDGALTMAGERFEAGPPPCHHFQLRAVSPGEATVRGVYTMPWGGTPREVRTYAVTVDPA